MECVYYTWKNSVKIDCECLQTSWMREKIVKLYAFWVHTCEKRDKHFGKIQLCFKMEIYYNARVTKKQHFDVYGMHFKVLFNRLKKMCFIEWFLK